MLHRKPRKGDALLYSADHCFPVDEWLHVGVVDRVDGNICHYKDSSGESQHFIWWFEPDKIFNRLFRILDETDEGVYETTAELSPVDESITGNGCNV